MMVALKAKMLGSFDHFFCCAGAGAEVWDGPMPLIVPQTTKPKRTSITTMMSSMSGNPFPDLANAGRLDMKI